MRDAPAGLSLADAGVQLVDADGDGRTDLLVTQDGLAGYYPTAVRRRVGPRARSNATRGLPASTSKIPRCAWWTSTATASRTPSAPEASLECFFNARRCGWNETRRGRAPGHRKLPERQLLRPARQVGRHDRRRAAGHRPRPRRQRRVLAVPRTRRLGAARHHAPQPAHSPTATTRKRVLLGDVDGDGLADLVYVGRQPGHALDQPGRQRLERPDRDQGHPARSPMSTRCASPTCSGRGSPACSGAPTPGACRASGMNFLDLTGGSSRTC